MCLLAVVFFAGFVCRETAAQEESYTVAIPMIKGFEETRFTDIFRDINDVIGKKLDCDVTTEFLVFEHDETLIELVREKFDEGEADVSYINGIDQGEYMLNEEEDLDFLSVLGMENSPVEQTCFFVRKGEFSDVSELRGKRWRGSQTIQARFLLYQNDIDEPLNEFFGDIGFETDSPIMPLLDDLESGEIDVFSTYLHTVRLSGALASKDAFLEPLYCHDTESHWVFVADKDMPEKRRKQIRWLMLNAHKDKDFAQFGFAFAMIEGHFMPLTDEAKKVNLRYAKLVNENGWREEQEEFFEEYFTKWREQP